ncbi:cysteine protease, putative, partial [Entamoeba invadens IP1]
MTMYTKTYRTGAEEEFRYGIFKKNLEDIRRLNKERRKRTDAHHDINMYTDLLDNELPINHHMEVLVSTQDKKFGELFNKTTKSALKGDQKWNEIPSLPSGDNLPKYHAYCGDYVKSNTERVKVDFCGEQVNQASCGCCYATALANLGQYLYTNLTYQQYGCVKHSAIPKFGVQRYLDITSTSATKRCCGGNSKDVMNAVPSFSLESDYP